MSDITGPTVKINADASGVDSAIQHITQQFDTLQTKAAGIGGKFEALGASMSKVGGGLTVGVTAPMTIAVGAIGALTQQAAIFQDKLSEVYTLLPNMNQEAMDKMTADVNEFTANFGISAEEAIPALYNAISAGVPAENVFTFLETAAQTSIGGVTDLTSAVDVLTSVVNAYGENNLTTADAADVLFTGVKMGKTTIGELSSNMSKVAPLAASMGLSLDQVVAGLDSMTMQGEGTAEAATKLKGMLAELTKEGSQADTVFRDLAGKGFKQFIQEGGTLEQALKIMSDGAKAQGTDITNFFGSIQAGMGALLLSSEQGMQKYMAAMNEMDNREGASVKAYEARADSAAQKMRQIREEMNSMAREIGESFLPVLKDDILPILKDDLIPYIQNSIVPAIKGFADWFKGLDDGSKKAAAGVGIFAAALGPLLMVLGPIVSAGGSLLKTLATIGTVAKGAQLTGVATGISGLGTAASGATPALAALFGPAGILAIGLGAGALAAYSTNLGGFRDNINGIIKEVDEAAANISTGNYEAAGRDMAQAVGKGFETVKDLIIKGLPEAEEIFSDFKSGVDSAAKEITEGFTKQLTQGLIDSIANIKLPSIGPQTILTKEMYEANMQAVIEDIKNSFSNIDFTSVGASIIGTLFSGMSGAIPGLSVTLKGILEGALKGTFGTISNSMLDDVAKKFGLSTAEVQAMLKGQGPLGIGDTLSNWYGESKSAQSTNSTPINPANLTWGGLTKTDTQSAVVNGVVSGMGNAAPVIAEQTGKSAAEQLAIDRKMYDRGQLDIAAAERLLEKAPQLADKYKQNTPAGTASDPLVVTTTTSTGSTPAASTTSPGTFERPSGNIPDLFTRDPAKYVEQELKSILNGGFDGSIAAYESYLKEFGMTLEDKTKQIFTDAKSKGFGGNTDYSDWLPKAMKAFQSTGAEAKTTIPELNTLNSAFEKIGLTGSGLSDVLSNVNLALSDHYANLQESQDYLSKYNDAAGENVKYTKDQEGQTKDLMNSLSMLGTAQNMYNQYMSDGVLDATESAHVQQALAQATKMMGDAGITAEGGISGLPGALQALASAAQAAMSQINAAISQAQSAAAAAASEWKLANAAGKYPSDKSQTSKININVSGNTFPSGTKPNDVLNPLIRNLIQA